SSSLLYPTNFTFSLKQTNKLKTRKTTKTTDLKNKVYNEKEHVGQNEIQNVQFGQKKITTKVNFIEEEFSERKAKTQLRRVGPFFTGKNGSSMRRDFWDWIKNSTSKENQQSKRLESPHKVEQNNKGLVVSHEINFIFNTSDNQKNIFSKSKMHYINIYYGYLEWVCTLNSNIAFTEICVDPISHIVHMQQQQNWQSSRTTQLPKLQAGQLK
ncbi:hypothetical protein STEG23_026476, partial [Scotinomys teguina]